MKRTKIIFWVTTGLVSLMMAFSAYAQLTQPALAETFNHLGYPAYFRVELSIAKIIGVILLLAPIGATIKEWAYAGFTITFVSAFIALSAVGDPVSARIAPIIALILLTGSYLSYKKLNSERSTAAADA